MTTSFADRLLAVINLSGKKPTPWARDHGFSPSSFDDWLNQGRQPRTAQIARLVAETGIPEEWWLRGDLPPPPVIRGGAYSLPSSSEPLILGSEGATRLKVERAKGHAGPMDTIERGQFAQVPFFDVRASAGHGAFVADQAAARYYAFDREWLALHVGVPERRLALIPVSGTSMEPDLRDGDLVMIDRGDIEVLREGVYVFELDDRLYVKRLMLRGDRLVVESSNGDYPPFELNTLLERPSFKIHGRVLGSPSFKRL